MAEKRKDNIADRSIITTRVIKAPRELVFMAFTDPKHLAHWYGPNGFSVTTQRMDFRSGGEWKYIMHGPDGTDYDNHIKYIEIKKPELIRWRHGGSGGGSHVDFETTLTLEDLGDKTKVTMTGTFESIEERNRVAEHYGAVEGGRQTIQRLDEYVTTLNRSGGVEPFVIKRTFKAPIDLMFRVWTESKHLANWMGPKGSVSKYSKVDLRVGGSNHYCLDFNGVEMWGLQFYKEVDPPNKLAYLQSFSDKDRNITHHPMAPTWPKQMYTTVTFTEMQGYTTVRVEWVPVNASQEEIDTFEAGRPGMTGGWSGSFDQLEQYLKEL